MGINFKISLGAFVTAAIINLVTLCLSCFAETVSLKWDANTEQDLAGYKIYYKAHSATLPFNGAGATEGASPIDVHNQNSANISGLDPAYTYYIAVTAYNTSGIESAYSNVVTVSESAPPSVSITSPANNSSVNGTVSVTANASDNVGVAKVEFYVDGALSAAINTIPYIYYWNANAAAGGSHTLSARAYDAAGNVSSSNLVTVSISAGTTQQSAIFGDLNGDGLVDLSDALLTLQIAAGNAQPTPDELQRGDIAPLINGTSVPDGIIDIGDVIVVLSKLVSKPAT